MHKRLLLWVLIIGCLASAGGLLLRLPASPRLDGVNVLFIAIDTLHARHLGAYTPQLGNSPAIDALAREGALFSNAYAVAPWTKPSFASIFTSVMPSRHGLTGVRDVLRPELTAMAEFFKAGGFRTVGIASHILLNQNSGLAQGFDEYTQVNKARDVHTAVTSQEVSDRAIAWLKEHGRDRPPFLMFLHFFDPHFRYAHHPEHSLTDGYSGTLQPSLPIDVLQKQRNTFRQEDVEYLKNLYREEIAFTDAQIGRVIQELGALGLAQNTLIVLTADHGEEFMEHGGLGHTRTLYDELLRVPLIFYAPGRISPAVYKEPVNQLDILPTLLDLACRHERRPEWEGRTLAPLLMGHERSLPAKDLFSEVLYRSPRNPKVINPDMVSVRSGGHKLIHDRIRRRWLLFDLEADPEERNNIAPQNSDLVEELAQKMRPLEDDHEARNRSSPHEEPKLPASKEDLQRLKSLGYF